MISDRDQQLLDELVIKNNLLDAAMQEANRTAEDLVGLLRRGLNGTLSEKLAGLAL